MTYWIETEVFGVEDAALEFWGESATIADDEALLAQLHVRLIDRPARRETAGSKVSPPSPTRLVLEIDAGQGLIIGVTDDETTLLGRHWSRTRRW